MSPNTPTVPYFRIDVPGTYRIRALPPTRRGLPFIEYGVHYRVQDMFPAFERPAVPCLCRTLRDPCPLCAAAGNPAARRHFPDVPALPAEQARSLWAAWRYACNVIDAAALDRGAQLWCFGRLTMNLLRPLFRDPWGHCSLARGRWLTLTIEYRDGRLAVTDITPDPSPSVLHLASRMALDFNFWIAAELVPVEEMRRCMGLEAPRDEGKAISRQSA